MKVKADKRGPMTEENKDYGDRILRDILRAKAENTRVDSIEMIAKDAKSIAIEARSLALKHECVQLTRLNDMQDTLRGWTKWARGAFLSVLALVVTISIAAFSWVDDLGDKRRESDSKVDQLTLTLEQVTKSQDEIKSTLSQNNEQATKDRSLKRLTRLVERVLDEKVESDSPVN